MVDTELAYGDALHDEVRVFQYPVRDLEGNRIAPPLQDDRGDDRQHDQYERSPL
jgi:hypothetical protein